MAPGAWIRDNLRVYVGNAAAVRDFRTQLRGNRPAWIWTLYLLVLIGFALLFYSSNVETGRISISEAQRRLQLYYQSTTYLLAFLISTIAPALTASAIVSERQRHSLDLIFSAPVSPKYLLVGKLISSYRYVWMLLVLSLPVTASCVVLGGATWSDVLQAYALLSLHGLLFTAIALLFSTVSASVVSAFIWSYLTVLIYLGIVSGFGSASMGLMYLHRTTEAPFSIGLSPFLVARAAGTYMEIGTYHVPNLVLVALYTLFLCRLVLLGAASSMSPAGSRETLALRIQGLIGYGFASFLFACATVGTFNAVRGAFGSGRSSLVWPILGTSFAGWIVFVGLIVPFLTCYSRSAESKFQLDGTFNFRRLFRGTPSGGLPYLFALVTVSGLAAMLGALFGTGDFPPVRFFIILLWGFVLLFGAWSIGRLTSAVSKNLRTARTLHYGGLVIMWLLPLPFLAATGAFFGTGPTVWDAYPLSPVWQWSTHPMRTLALTLFMGITALGITYWAHTIEQQRAPAMRPS